MKSAKRCMPLIAVSPCLSKWERRALARRILNMGAEAPVKLYTIAALPLLDMRRAGARRS